MLKVAPFIGYTTTFNSTYNGGTYTFVYLYISWVTQQMSPFWLHRKLWNNEPFSTHLLQLDWLLLKVLFLQSLVHSWSSKNSFCYSILSGKKQLSGVDLSWFFFQCAISPECYSEKSPFGITIVKERRKKTVNRTPWTGNRVNFNSSFYECLIHGINLPLYCPPFMNNKDCVSWSWSWFTAPCFYMSQCSRL